jgi:hypothetical protein
MLSMLRTEIMRCEAEWGGLRPVVTLACAGGSDEHWQIWHPDDYRAGGMPHLVVMTQVTVGTTVERHPDSIR